MAPALEPEIDAMNLRWALFTRGMQAHDQLRQKLQQKIRKLGKHLKHFPEDAVHLQVNIERHPKKALFQAGLTLRLPSNQVRAEKSGPDPLPAVDQAVKPFCASWRFSNRLCGTKATGKAWPAGHEFLEPLVAEASSFWGKGSQAEDV